MVLKGLKVDICILYRGMSCTMEYLEPLGQVFWFFCLLGVTRKRGVLTSSAPKGPKKSQIQGMWEFYIRNRICGLGRYLVFGYLDP